MKWCIILIFALCLITLANASEIGKNYYKPYECENLKIGDVVTYSFYWRYWTYKGKPDFVGVVTKVEPKPTTEYMHWITIKKLSGQGESGVYSEQFLERIQVKK